jgi:Arc/MetJ-type ribon-helix-helix transcriptional regulator
MTAEPGGPELSALEEALRQALQAASREQVLRTVAVVLPQQTKAAAKPGLQGRVGKVSVSMPSELTEAVRSRTGAGGFSRYVSEAVQQRLKHDLLDDLLSELEAEHGPIPQEIREETRRMWPDESP